ncbi:MAG: hypothetical protein ACJAQW_000618 [Paracoccaceae bacterium]|jgi:hypothetical protein
MPSGFDNSVASANNAGFQTAPGGQFIVLSCGMKQPNPDYHPCDVTGFEVKVEGESPKVSCTGPASTDASLTAAQKTLLAGQDMLLQIVSDVYREDRGGDPKKVVLAGTTAPACHHSEHALITLKRVSGPVAVPQEWKMSTPAPVEVLAPEASIRASFFERYWPFGRDGTHLYDAKLVSCGIPADETQAGVAQLNARIEVFRESNYKLTFTVPKLAEAKLNASAKRNLQTLDETIEISGSARVAVAEVSAKGSATRNSDGTVTAASLEGAASIGGSGIGGSVAYDGGSDGGQGGTTYSTARTGDGVIATFTETQVDGSNPRITYNQTLDDVLVRRATEVTVNPGGTTEVSNSTEFNFDKAQAFSLTYNGDKVPVVEVLGAVLNLPTTISDFVKEMKDSVPTIGWTAELAVGVLEGSVTGSWYLTPNASATHDRIWEVGRGYSISFDCSLVTISLSIGFGVEWVLANPVYETPLIEMVLKASVTLSFKVDANFTVDSGGDETFSNKLTGECVPDFVVTAQAKASGVGFEATIKIETGFDAEFTFTGGFSEEPKMPGKISFLPLKVSFTYQLMTSVQTIKLFNYPNEKVTLWEGDLFAKEAGATV